MKRIAALALAISGVALCTALAQPRPDATPVGGPIAPPARRAALPVPALLQTRAHEIFMGNCQACHGTDLKGGSAPSLFTTSFLDSHTDAQIVAAVTDGGTAPNHGFKTLYTPDEISQLPAYLRIRGGALNTHQGAIPDINGKSFHTEKADFKAETLVSGLDQPWGMAFLPDGRAIFTERAGRLRFMNKDGSISEPVKGTPTVFDRQDGGMLDVALPPDFAKTGWIYLSYSTVRPDYVLQPGDDNGRNLAPPAMTVIVRGKVDANNEWVEQQTLFQADPEFYRNTADHFGSRFLFDGKGHFFWSMGERHDYQASQNLAAPLGKIHRMNMDGTIPKDNPFVNTPGALPSIWSYGHRNPEGLTYDPATGLLWETEHGPTGGDEVNIIEPGKDYGWGVVTMGLEPGIWRTHAAGMTQPITFYNPSIGPGGITFYKGDKFPAWKNNLFITGMVGQTLIRMEINGRTIAHQERILQDYGRVREVLNGPDGNLYILLQNRNGDPKGGSIVRLSPAK